MSPAVTLLTRYPLKSGAPNYLREVSVSPQGLEGDREFMVAREALPGEAKHGEELRMCTQRESGKEALANISVAQDQESYFFSAPGLSSLVVPRGNGHSQPSRSVQVCDQVTHGLDLGDEASRWLTDYLGPSQGKDLRLLRKDPRATRKIPSGFVTALDAHTAFADGYPILVISHESLRHIQQELHKRDLAESIRDIAKRFRANVCIIGFNEAFVEDNIKLLQLGENLVLELMKPCSRCTIPSVNQTSCERDEVGKAILGILAKTRRGSALGFARHFPDFSEADLNKTFFGMNAIVRHVGSGVLRVNDVAKVLAFRQNT